MPVYDDFMDWILYPFSLFSVFLLFVLYSFIGGLTITSWKKLSGEIRGLILALGVMGLIGVAPKILEVFTFWSTALWCGILLWVYSFHVFEEGMAYTIQWVSQVLRMFSPTIALGLRLGKKTVPNFHVWGVLKTLQWGVFLIAVTTIFDISIRLLR